MLTDTENDPVVDTVIDCVVAPFDHKFPEDEEDVKITDPPSQNVVLPFALIVGVTGTLLDNTTVVFGEVFVHPLLSMPVTE